VLDLMVKCKLAPSKKEARRLVEQGGVETNGEKVSAATVSYTAEDLAGDGLMLKKGKKVYHRAYLG
jgi:tyrosyl-tRNA synthetase